MISLIKRYLTGITIPQEYVCVGLEELSDPLLVYLETESGRKEISSDHLFLGYKPLVVALVSDGFVTDSIIRMSFVASSPHQKIAELTLRNIGEKDLGSNKVQFYEGINGSHHLLSGFHQMVNNLMERFKKKPPGNVSLEGNLYEQVRIIYSLPRKISLITTCRENRINIFPTDLHGAVGASFYLSSLRLGGEACKQAELIKKIVISDIEASHFKEVYTLGKNHMREMQAVTDFNLAGEQSEMLGYPLPKGTIAYREIEIADHFDIGIHRIFIYKVIHSKTLKKATTLTHVHRYYAQWRKNQGLKTKFLLR